MTSIPNIKSMAEFVDPKALSSTLSWTAGGASDSQLWTGITINRSAFSTGAMPRSMDAMVLFDATLASGQSLSLKWALQDSPDGTNWSDYITETATIAVSAPGPTGAKRAVGVARMLNQSSSAPTGTPGADLAGARQYVRLNVTPHLTAALTDTAIIISVGEFGGFDFLAAPQT